MTGEVATYQVEHSTKVQAHEGITWTDGDTGMTPSKMNLIIFSGVGTSELLIWILDGPPFNRSKS